MSMIIPNVEELVSAEHRYRKLLKVVDWVELSRPLRSLYSKSGRRGYAVEQVLKTLFLQFLEDKSDRQMEWFLVDSIAGKYFCNFGLVEKTPDYTTFAEFRNRIGTKRLSELFARLVKSLKKEKLAREVYTFVDSAKIIACVDTWKARDKAIEDAQNQQKDDDGKPTMNNRNLSGYVSDPDARFGVKGKNNIWIGYKRHLAIDVTAGLITKVFVTPGNVHDGVAFEKVAPETGAVLADKLYSDGPGKKAMERLGLYSMAIKKKNSKEKNRELDRFRSTLRMPFEGVFSKMSHRARYRSTAKVQFQALMEALVFNLKRLVACNISAVPIA